MVEEYQVDGFAGCCGHIPFISIRWDGMRITCLGEVCGT